MYIDSIMQGTDADIIPGLVKFYTGKDEPDILDATYGKGRFWAKSNFQHLVAIDIDPRLKDCIIADNTSTPFNDKSFDVIIYDPPHIQRQADVDDLRQSIVAYYNLRTTPQSYQPFLREAYRLLRLGGFVIAKISDEVSKPLWNHVLLIDGALAVGFIPYDFIIKHRQLSIRNPAQQQHRARKCHCFYIILERKCA